MLLAQGDWEDANISRLHELLDRYRDRHHGLMVVQFTSSFRPAEQAMKPSVLVDSGNSTAQCMKANMRRRYCLASSEFFPIKAMIRIIVVRPTSSRKSRSACNIAMH